MPKEIELLEVALIVLLLLISVLAVCLVVRCIYIRRNKSKFLDQLRMINYSTTSGSIKGFTAAPFRPSSTFSNNNRFSNQRQSSNSIKSVKIETRDPDPLTNPEGNRCSKSPFVLEVIRECEEKIQEMDLVDEVNLNSHCTKKSTEQLLMDNEKN